MSDEQWKEIQKQIKKEASEEPPVPEDEAPPIDQSMQQAPPQDQTTSTESDESLTIINRKKLKPQRRIQR